MCLGSIRKRRAEVALSIFVFFVGIGLMLVAPLLRRYRKASLALACGAAAVLAVAVVGLVHVGPRIGEAAIVANRRQYLYVLTCELPVFVLALTSLKHFKLAFWLGWAINLVFALYVTVIFIWLEFFLALVILDFRARLRQSAQKLRYQLSGREA
jgi:FtsH-binding integral membrane protein